MKQIEPKNHKNPLKNIFNCPAKLYIRGDTDILDLDCLYICIIGARKHSEYGRQVVRGILREIKHYNPIVISGLATGIDSIALQESLELGLRTIAVLGSGLDDESIYPRTNIRLANQIIERGGLLLSEYAPGTSAQKWTFPQRNRIMAGLSHTIIVIEGNRQYGTLITARLGLEFGKTIVSVPGSIFSPLSAGPLSLIADGAIPLTCPEDILSIHNLEKNQLALRDRADRDMLYSRCNADELILLEKLAEPKTRDQLLVETKYTADRLQIVILTLEIKGLIEEKMSKIVRR